MTEEIALALMMSLLPPRLRDAERLRPTAHAVVGAATNQTELRVLIAIAFSEQGFAPHSRYPFGWMRATPETTLDEAAPHALAVYRAGLRTCGVQERAFRYYNAGTCVTERRPSKGHRVARARWIRARAYGSRMVHIMRRMHR